MINPGNFSRCLFQLATVKQVIVVQLCGIAGRERGGVADYSITRQRRDCTDGWFGIKSCLCPSDSCKTSVSSAT